MPDFDPKSIPILDDVIEDIAEVKDAAPVLKEAADENHDLFTTDHEQAETKTKSFSVETFSTDELADNITDIPDADSEAFESALIDYDAEQTNHVVEVETSYEPFKYQQQTSEDSTIDEPYTAAPVIEQPIITRAVENQPMPDQAASEQLAPAQKEEPSTEALPLQSITDEIVKQLMPDLETQLRHLIQQALEDRLSDETIKTSQSSTPDDD